MRRDSARNSGGSSLAGSSSRACGDAPVRSVSIIVPVLNESSTIDALQDQLDRIDLDAERCEVVFVDGGSTDGTRERVRPRYRVVTQRGRGRGGARGCGLSGEHRLQGAAFYGQPALCNKRNGQSENTCCRRNRI